MFRIIKRSKITYRSSIVFGVTFILLGITDSAGQIVVGRNVQVSKVLENMPHYELLLAADPGNPDRLLGGSMVWSEEKNKFLLVAYASFDGGRTWTPTLTVDEKETFQDPVPAYGPDGAAYFAGFGDTAGGEFEMLLYRSKDAGKSWLPPVKVEAMDREYISVDDTGGKYDGRVYIHGTRGIGKIDGGGYSGVTIARSTDGGATFVSQVKPVSAEDQQVYGMGNSVVLSDGTLVVLFGVLRNVDRTDPNFLLNNPTKPTAWLKVLVSRDGGETFPRASTVGDYYIARRIEVGFLPYLAGDRSHGIFRDRLYAAWADLRSGRSEILFASSADKGNTWSKPIVVNDDRPPLDAAKGPDHLMPVVAVNRDGVVGVMWYDRRDISDNLGWRTRFSVSLDGGETFQPSVAVSEAPFSHRKDDKWLIASRSSRGGDPGFRRGGALKLEAGVHGFYFGGGHTAGLAADANGLFHPFWVDNRTGIAQVWTTDVKVASKAYRNGSAELESLDDISDKVYLKYSNMRFDRAKNILYMDAQIENTSQDAVTGPVKVRLLSLTSQIGVPKLLGAENGQSSAGAVLDFTSLIKDGGLAPKQLTAVKRLEFTVSDLRPLRPSKDFMVRLVNLEAKVLGKAVKLLVDGRK